MRPTNVFKSIISKLEPEYTLRLVEIVYSKAHGHEICVMQLVGKNAFPKYTAEEILSDPGAMIGLSPQDAVTITHLDYSIKERKKRYSIMEIDRNGTVLMQNPDGDINRYSERTISSQREILSHMHPEDAHDLGYRVGFKDGIYARKYMRATSKKLKSKIVHLIEFIKNK